MIDKRLELILIENGFNPNLAEHISPERVCQILTEEMTDCSRQDSGLILFTGLSTAQVHSGVSRSVIRKNALGIKGHPRYGLTLFSPYDWFTDSRESPICLDYDCIDGMHYIEAEVGRSIMSASVLSKGEPVAKIQVYYHRNAAMYYFPRLSREEELRMTLTNIAEQTGLEVCGDVKGPRTVCVYDYPAEIYYLNGTRAGIQIQYAFTIRDFFIRAALPEESNVQEIIQGLYPLLEDIHSKYGGEYRFENNILLVRLHRPGSEHSSNGHTVVDFVNTVINIAGENNSVIPG